ncbi:MAG TPA: hypothetical protein VNA69_00350 [Thermoanaerobaculia bacterium]|nr:hypothetical protein [Thermoanaerobaculia bacterium]
MQDEKRFDAEAVLQFVSEATASLEAVLTPEEREAVNRGRSEDETPSLVYSEGERGQALEDFELLAAADAMSGLANDIQAMIATRMDKLYRQGLEVYYAAVELAKDPEHAHLIPHVEAMRKAHEAQYGKPIPPRPEPPAEGK